MRVAILSTESLHGQSRPPMDTIRRKTNLRFPQPHVRHHFVATFGIRIMEIFEHTHVRTVPRHDVRFGGAIKGVQPQLRPFPVHSVLRGRIQQIPTHLMHRARTGHLGDRLFISQDTLVPELEDLFLLVPKHIGVKIVQRVFPRLVRLKERVLIRFHRRTQHPLHILCCVNHPRVDHQMLSAVRLQNGLPSSQPRKT